MNNIQNQLLLLRQVHPNFLQDGKPSSQAFFPFPKDKGKLSVYDGRLITPVQSFIHYTQRQNLCSAGVWGVNNAEVNEIGMTYEPDPLSNSPAHALIDFGIASDKEYRKMAKRLKIYAEIRGCLYAPEQMN